MPGIPKEHIEELWPTIEDLLVKAIEKSEYSFTIEDVKIDCLSGEYILWIARNGLCAVVLAVSDYHRGKQCDIVMIGGNKIDSWLNELVEIEDWAKRVGCDRMILTGRQGWIRKLPDYEVKTITMVKTW